jgi:flagellar hook assembly protein FlgD
LYQNFPNPFNPTTTIRFLLPEQSPIKLSILDLLGRSVVTILDEVKPAGDHVVGWNGRDESGIQVSSGVYYYRLVTPTHIMSRKLVLLR